MSMAPSSRVGSRMGEKHPAAHASSSLEREHLQLLPRPVGRRLQLPCPSTGLTSVTPENSQASGLSQGPCNLRLLAPWSELLLDSLALQPAGSSFQAPIL